MSEPIFNRLVRFKTAAGKVFLGEADEDATPNLTLTKEALIGKTVRVYRGTSPLDCDFQLSDEREVIHEVLSPLSEVPIFYGIGLNYKAHAKEANIPTGDYPTVFTKPPDSLAGPFEDIFVKPEIQFLDYEASKRSLSPLDPATAGPVSDLAEDADPTPFILGYTVGNDVSSRYWQNSLRSGGQHGSGKAFDKFAPIGPVIASPKAVPDPSALSLTTKVNGELRQKTGTDDLIFDIHAIFRHLSRGRTLRPGTVIMTGTPSGVAAFMKPPEWLKNGDLVEIEITGLGKIANRMLVG
ncbi:hypothetical protein CLAIMM_00715 [Cladophialophora immunda]|nr:hypothetical protein CLAIMM_00715 [Cladophialophora immunda]